MYTQIFEELNLAPATQNNSREIVRERLERMHSNPNDRNAKALDALGLSVDFDDYRDRMGEFEQSLENN